MKNHAGQSAVLQHEVAKGGQYKGILLGLLAFIIFEYIRFGVWIPVLEPLHLQRIIAIATLLVFAIFFKRRIYHPYTLLIFLAIIVVSTFVNIDNLSKARALTFFTTIIKIIAIYYLISNLLFTRDNIRKFITVFLSANIVLVFLGVLSGGSEGELSKGLLVGGFASDSNDYALAINIVIPFFWYLYTASKGWYSKAVFSSAFLLCIISVVFTFSRGGFLSLSAILFLIIIISKRRVKNLILLVLLLLISYSFIPSSYWEDMETISKYSEKDSRSTSQIRLNLWKIGLVMIAENPVFGVGPFNSAYQVVEYGRKIIPDARELHFLSGRFLHNTFISVASELGIPGLICFLTLIVMAYRNAVFTIKKMESEEIPKDDFLYALAQAIKVSLIGYCVSSIFLTTYHYPHIYLLGALAFALKLNATEMANRVLPENQPSMILLNNQVK